MIEKRIAMVIVSKKRKGNQEDSTLGLVLTSARRLLATTKPGGIAPTDAQQDEQSSKQGNHIAQPQDTPTGVSEGPALSVPRTFL